MSLPDASALALTAWLAFLVTVILLLLATPLAWWLSRTQSRAKPVVEAIVALPLVLPPTVLGFYLLILFTPENPLGAVWVQLTGSTLTFSFTGLVVASIIYSLPFAVQPLQTAFERIGTGLMEAAASLGARPWDAFFNIAAPLSWRGFLTAAVLSFAHTIGEFGVVLMVGGNIPGETRTVSIAIYEHVETMDYGEAHTLSAILLFVSFSVLLVVYGLGRRRALHVG